MHYKIICYGLIVLVSLSIIYFSVFIAQNAKEPSLNELYFTGDSSFAIRGQGIHIFEVYSDQEVILRGSVSGSAQIPFDPPKEGRVEVRVGSLSIHYER